MSKIYRLYGALVLNATGKKEDAMAAPVKTAEIRRHQHQFEFDFISISRKFVVYKIYLGNQPDIIQGLVAFRYQKDYLDCVNMEINVFNKHGISLYSGVGKCMVALCCKISIDNGSDGYISFEAKNRLIPYYQRLGAKRIGSSSRMFLDDTAAQKLVDLYF
ncbi:MAG TPA: hypothetical protein VG101_12250 [Puia sp.]|nr:hypothetical protein [Puia sp.]